VLSSSKEGRLVTRTRVLEKGKTRNLQCIIPAIRLDQLGRVPYSRRGQDWRFSIDHTVSGVNLAQHRLLEAQTRREANDQLQGAGSG